MQQVNLYLPELRPHKEWLTATTVLISVAGSVVMYLVFYLIAVANIESLEKQVIVLENQQVATQKQLDKFKTRSQPFQSHQLASQLEYLRAALKGRQQVGEIIEWQNLGNAEGFVKPLKALARQSISSISLEKISLSEGGQFLQIKGKTRQPEDIATYIQQLQLEPSFTSTKFGLLSVAEQANAPHHVFTLGFDSVYKLAMDRD